MYKGRNVDREENPRDTAGWFSILTFKFTYDIFRKTSRHELQEEDIYKVLKDFRSSELGDKLEKEWEYEKTRKKVTLIRPLLRMFGKEFIIYGVIQLFFDISLMSLYPLSIGKVVGYFDKESKVSLNEAYIYATVLVMYSVVSCFCNNWYELALSQLGLKIRAALCSLMYRKALKVTSASFGNVGGGQIVTLMAKDVTVFDRCPICIHDIFVGILRLFVLFHIAYGQIQISAFIAGSFLVLLLPIQAWLSMLIKKNRYKSAFKSDERLHKIQEILTSIKLIKLYTWESFFEKVVTALRVKEIRKIRNVDFIQAFILFVAQFGQRFSFYICIISYIQIFGNSITSEKAFVVMSSFSLVQFTLGMFLPWALMVIAESYSSYERIRCFLLLDESNVDYFKYDINKPQISLRDVTLEMSGRELLKDVNFEVTDCLVGLTGPVGVGKSSILKVILSDISVTSGKVSVCGILSYAAQEPWLFPATVKENILFGQTYEEERYLQVVEACSLIQDFNSLPLRDYTIVSDNGLNLSKGQRARINLARAIYRKADIYLLDDILATLDSTVAQTIFDKCCKKFLKNKLTILVCNNRRFLKKVDRLLIIDNNTVIDKRVRSNQNDFIKFDSNNITIDSNIDCIVNENPEADEKSELLVSSDQNKGVYGENKKAGKVHLDVYKEYFKHAGGWKYVPLYLMLPCLNQVFYTWYDIYITKWLKIEENLTSVREKSPNSTEYEESFEEHIIAGYIYTFLITAAVVTSVIELLTFHTLMAISKITMHQKVFSRILSAPMSFFDRNFSGNILNRFSKDFSVLDESLPYVMRQTLRMIFETVGAIWAIGYVRAALFIPTAIVIVVLDFMRRQFVQTSRSLARLENSTRAPLVGFLNTSLEGLTTIRATKNEKILIEQFDGHQDLTTSASYMNISTSRSFAFYLELVTCIYVAVIMTSFILFDPKDIFAGHVGLAMTQSFSLIAILRWGVRQATDVENQMTSVERVLEYAGLPSEATEGKSPRNWPNKGRIEYKNVNMKYSNSNRMILKDVDILINPGDKIGIIGRTGAGKSSIISILFRLYDIEGAVHIDNINAADVQLSLVRSKISIIPQEPILFNGTIRSNLDPYNEHPDVSLWNALFEVKLKQDVDKLPNGLDTVILDFGASFSMGQKQLFCLARAVLKNNRILVLDEATANIDPQTDRMIQQTISRVFKNCTILTVAHKLHTVLDSDKIMVVENGMVVDFDSPRNLLNRGSGIFYSLAKHSGFI